MRIHPDGVQGILVFSSSGLFFIAAYFSGIYLGFSSQLWGLTFWGPGLYFCLFNFILKYCYLGFTYAVSVRSLFLGYTFATGLYLSTLNAGWHIFGLYQMIMSIFHMFEFVAIAASNPATLSIDSFILNHSVQYGVAAFSSWMEWALEYYFFPESKQFHYLSYIGVLMCLSGEFLRKGAMLTARTNFNHIVQCVKASDHELVTNGVYSYMRHPSYVGWFYWSIGTQIILLNPICTVLYAMASHRFFSERVFEEEYTLIEFFGEKYITYQKKVKTGLPFIRGYEIDDS